MKIDMTSVDADRKKSALTCNSAENMFTCLTLPVFLWLL
eukprot:CAMPEP_0115384794 /NCGR_PEP_ID=MMETSP0271-20121206/7293_1 /TAXON_ID=71861 /ORGANISM="Scrippsiella trochoidea, Strain CCMP3099" /LENGTH=38 /DNA_ID= /DNA_START= /DNA_END= /DNA_ORIENTATION=